MKIFKIISSVLLMPVICISLLSCDTIFIGDVWYDTPEMAIQHEEEVHLPINEPGDYVIKTLLDINYFDDTAEVLYVSESDGLFLAGCKKSEKGKWGFSYANMERDLEFLDSFVRNGDEKQFLLHEYFTDENKTFAYGYKLTSAPDVLVNGEKTNLKTYKFTVQGKEWSVDYWWIDINNTESVNITYSQE